MDTPQNGALLYFDCSITMALLHLWFLVWGLPISNTTKHHSELLLKNKYNSNGSQGFGWLQQAAQWTAPRRTCSLLQQHSNVSTCNSSGYLPILIPMKMYFSHHLLGHFCANHWPWKSQASTFLSVVALGRHCAPQDTLLCHTWDATTHGNGNGNRTNWCKLLTQYVSQYAYCG